MQEACKSIQARALSDQHGRRLLLQVEEKRAVLPSRGRRVTRRCSFWLVSPGIAPGRLGQAYYRYCERVNGGVVRQDENAWGSGAPHDASALCVLFEANPRSRRPLRSTRSELTEPMQRYVAKRILSFLGLAVR